MPTDICPTETFCTEGTITRDIENSKALSLKPQTCPVKKFCIYGTSEARTLQPLDCIPGTVCNKGSGDTMGSEICQPGEYCTPDGKSYT